MIVWVNVVLNRAVVVESSSESKVLFQSTLIHYIHLDDHAQPTYEMTPESKPFTIIERAISVLSYEVLHMWLNVI